MSQQAKAFYANINLPYIYIYTICITGKAIRGNISFEIDRISPTEGRDDTEVENENIIFPHIARHEELIYYDF